MRQKQDQPDIKNITFAKLLVVSQLATSIETQPAPSAATARVKSAKQIDAIFIAL